MKVAFSGGIENCTDNDIRLVDRWHEKSGVVEVCANGVWGNICDDSEVPSDYLASYGFYWDLDNVAQVICRQLGLLEPNKSLYNILCTFNVHNVYCAMFSGAIVFRGLYEYLNKDSRPILLHHEEIQCEGTEDTLNNCDGYIIGAHSCTDTHGLYIQCPGKYCIHSLIAAATHGFTCYMYAAFRPENCTHNDVRLVGGRNSREGKVLVCVWGHWVIMCHDRWTHREAEVVCRQLHYLNPDSSNRYNIV